MRLTTGWESLAGTPAYTACPSSAAGALPAVLVIQEVWGVDEHIQDLADRFATAGYWAVAPDLFAQDGRRPAALEADRIETVKRFLDTAPPEVWRDPAARDAAVGALAPEQAAPMRETMALLLRPDRPYERWRSTLVTVAAAVRGHERCSGRVMSTGYCLGGHLSALLAGADPDLAAAAIYYGASPDMSAMESLHCPLIGFYGGLDERINATVPAFEEFLRGAGRRFEAHVYPGAPHAFFNDTRPSYRVDAARDAWARTLKLFAEVAA